MTKEPLSYRARKWVLQQVSTLLKRSNQHDRLAECDWDVLVIMDACRYDVLTQVTNWPVERCRSPGSATGQWLEQCSESGVLENAYIATGNPQYTRYNLSSAMVEHVWKNHYSDRYGNVPPDPILNSVDEMLAADRSPVVAHLNTPHAPYIAKIKHTWVSTLPNVDVWRRNPARDQDDKLSPQVAMASGQVDGRRALAGYRASVESTWNVVLRHVAEWITDNQTVVVTADHGETFGRVQDWTMYGHPNRVHLRPLVEVPWVVFEQTLPLDEGDTPETAEETLQALGYVDS